MGQSIVIDHCLYEIQIWINSLPWLIMSLNLEKPFQTLEFLCYFEFKLCLRRLGGGIFSFGCFLCTWVTSTDIAAHHEEESFVFMRCRGYQHRQGNSKLLLIWARTLTRAWICLFFSWLYHVSIKIKTHELETICAWWKAVHWSHSDIKH